MRTVRLATRASALALAQTQWVAGRLGDACRVEELHVRTEGDRDRQTPLHEAGGAGLFTRAVNRAVLDGDADAAVHSLKDLPTQLEAGLVLAAVPERAPAEDLLVGPGADALERLPGGAVVATGSLRRRAQLLRLRPDLRIEPIRGNVETRLRRIEENGWTATVLARAGLERLGLRPRSARLGPAFLPAPAQGALGIVARAEEAALAALLARLEHAPSRACVEAERAFLAAMETGCHAPVAARAVADDRGGLHLAGAVLSLDGRLEVRAAHDGTADDPAALGRRVADEVKGAGGAEILRSLEKGTSP